MKISKFCKKVMNHENGPFDNLARKSVKYKWRKLEIHSKFTLFFICNLLVRESKIWKVTNYWKEKGLIDFIYKLSIRKPFYFRLLVTIQIFADFLARVILMFHYLFTELRYLQK